MSVLPIRYTVQAVDGTFLSAALVNGTPACSYTVANVLMFAKNAVADGSGSWTLTTVFTSTSAVAYTSLLVVQGFPAIAFQQTVGGVIGVYYVRALDNNGSTWGSPVAVVSTSGINKGFYCSMTNVNGSPAIAYENLTQNIVEYVRAIDQVGTIWSDIVPVSGVNEGGQNVNLKVFNGAPAVCYYDNIRFALIYIISNTTTGLPQSAVPQTWADAMVINPNSAGIDCSLAELSNNPMISYYQLKTGFGNNVTRLQFVSAKTNGFVNVKWAPDAIINVSSKGSSGATSICNLNGFPVISYRNGENTSLNMATSTSMIGANWYLQTLDDSVDAGRFISSIAVGSKVGTFYTDGTTPALKYIY